MKYFTGRQEDIPGSAWEKYRFYPAANEEDAKRSMRKDGDHSPGCANVTVKLIEQDATNGSSAIFAEINTIMEDHESGCWRVVVTGQQGQFYPPVRFETYQQAVDHIEKTIFEIKHGKEIDENMAWARARLAAEEEKQKRRTA